MSTKEQQGWNALIGLLSKTKDPELLSHYLSLLLTPEEKEALAMRYLITQELLMPEKKPQREIAKDLGVSIAKITRGSNELKRTPQAVLDHLKKRLIEKKQ